MTRIAISLLFVSIALASPLSSSVLEYAPLVEEHHPHGTVNNSYIVAFKDDVPPQLMLNHMNFLQDIHSEDPLLGDDLSGIRHVYDGPFTGYAGRFTTSVINKIRASPEVAYIEKDQIVHTTQLETQNSAPWVRETPQPSSRNSDVSSFVGLGSYESSFQTYFWNFHQVLV